MISNFTKMKLLATSCPVKEMLLTTTLLANAVWKPKRLSAIRVILLKIVRMMLTPLNCMYIKKGGCFFNHNNNDLFFLRYLLGAKFKKQGLVLFFIR